MEHNLIPSGPREYPLREAYKMKDGTVYYTFRDVTELPFIRYAAINNAIQFAQLGMDRDSMLQLINKQADLMNKGSLTEAFAITEELRQRLELQAEADSMMHVATVLYVLPDERLTDYKQSLTVQKIKHWESDPEAQDFFLQQALDYAVAYSQLSDSITLQHLKKAARTARKFPQLRSVIRSKPNSANRTS